jgi:orotate phosphoribosyltransferase-like protein
MKKIIVLSLITVTALSACASRPNKIGPAGIDISAQQGKSCSKLSSDLFDINKKVIDLSSQQDRAATNDAIGVFLVGVPTGSLTGGDVETDLAIAKGKAVSIKEAMALKGC